MPNVRSEVVMAMIMKTDVF